MENIQWYPQATLGAGYPTLHGSNAQAIDSYGDSSVDFFVYADLDAIQIREYTGPFTWNHHTTISLPNATRAIGFLDIDNDDKIESLFIEDKHYIYSG